MPLTPNELRAEISLLWQHIDEKHASMREFVNERFNALEHRLAQQEHEDRGVEKRVTVIEVLREAEDKQALKRATWVGMLSSMLLTAVIQTIRYFFGGKG